MMADHFVGDEAQEFLAAFGIELGVFRQRAQPRDLRRVTRGLGSAAHAKMMPRQDAFDPLTFPGRASSSDWRYSAKI